MATKSPDGDRSLGEEDLPLGKQTEYVSLYNPSLLCAIPRQNSRDELGLSADDLPFDGVDIWTAYELSWLGVDGKPIVAVAQFQIPCKSDFIVESKSLKLYLNSFNQTKFRTHAEVVETIEIDLSGCVKSTVLVDLHTLEGSQAEGFGNLVGECIDVIEVPIDDYQPRPELLRVVDENIVVREALHSHLLKTNCPVTGQPDWASIFVEYTGPKISHGALLQYIISFREYSDFHEHCVERIFTDILERCGPSKLTVYARYTRRGGVDINPFRTNCGAEPDIVRLVRQ